MAQNDVKISGRVSYLKIRDGVGKKQHTVVSFSLGTNVGTGDFKKLMFTQVEMWNPKDNVIKTLQISEQEKTDIDLIGRLDVDVWEDKETGKTRRKHKIVAFGARPEQKEQPADDDDSQGSDEEEFDSDVPF